MAMRRPGSLRAPCHSKTTVKETVVLQPVFDLVCGRVRRGQCKTWPAFLSISSWVTVPLVQRVDEDFACWWKNSPLRPNRVKQLYLVYHKKCRGYGSNRQPIYGDGCVEFFILDAFLSFLVQSGRGTWSIVFCHAALLYWVVINFDWLTFYQLDGRICFFYTGDTC